MAGGRDAGSMFGHYRLEALIGRGGMGEVYRAYDTSKDRVVALKLLPESLASDTEYRARFTREARTAARLQEPHVIPIHDFGEIDGLLYIDMRLVSGQDLRGVLRENPRGMPPERAVAIVSQVAAALDAAHSDGLVHRDVKPENVLVAEHDFAYLADFGIAASETDTRLTGDGSAIGSVAYMSPERFRDEPVTPSSDTYALACVLQECLTGRPPFRTRTAQAAVAAHLYDAPPPVSHQGAPPAFDAVLARALAKDPARRTRTPGELAAAAQSALDGRQRRDASTIMSRAQPGVAAAPGTHRLPGAGVPTAARPTAARAATPRPSPTGGGAARPQPRPQVQPPVTPLRQAPPRTGRPASSGSSYAVLWGIAAAALVLLAVALGFVLGPKLMSDGSDKGGGGSAPSSSPGVSSAGDQSATDSEQVAVSSGSTPTDEPSTPSDEPSPSDTAPPEPTREAPEPTPTPTTEPQGALSGPGYDRQGWSNTKARCNADDPAKTVGHYEKSYLVICARADNGVLYYRGYRTTDGAAIEIAHPVRTAEGWQVDNKGYLYTITPSRLTITQGSTEHLNESAVRYDSE